MGSDDNRRHWHGLAWLSSWRFIFHVFFWIFLFFCAVAVLQCIKSLIQAVIESIKDFLSRTFNSGDSDSGSRDSRTTRERVAAYRTEQQPLGLFSSQFFGRNRCSRVGTARDGATVESGTDGGLSEGLPRPPQPPESDSDRPSHNLNVPDAPPNYDRATTTTAPEPPPAYDSLYPPDSPSISKAK